MHAGRVHLQAKIPTSLRKIHYIVIACLRLNYLHSNKLKTKKHIEDTRKFIYIFIFGKCSILYSYNELDVGILFV